jgi:hypothetical protein
MRNLAKGDLGSSMRDLIHMRNCRSKRASSYDIKGGNADAWDIKPGETKVLADLKGSGCINHIWFTIRSEDPHHHRKMILRMYWDGEENPSVESPVGDFFGVGHCKTRRFQSLPFSMTGSSDIHSGMNCFFHMPYGKSARIEIVNESDDPGMGLYFYIDYDEYDEPLGEDILYFHAKWRRENPCDGWYKSELKRPGNTRHHECNSRMQTSGEGNYVILDAEGTGHYVGCNMSIHNLMGGWWGEGDDMIFIDGEGWPPSLHGTGSEDYLCNAWGMQSHDFLYYGSSLHDSEVRDRSTVYRFHIEDPIAFRKSILVTIEHGHANSGSDDYASTAYWYQTEPHKVWAPMPPVEQRLPNPDIQEPIAGDP